MCRLPCSPLLRTVIIKSRSQGAHIFTVVHKRAIDSQEKRVLAAALTTRSDGARARSRACLVRALESDGESAGVHLELLARSVGDDHVGLALADLQLGLLAVVRVIEEGVEPREAVDALHRVLGDRILHLFDLRLEPALEVVHALLERTVDVLDDEGVRTFVA
eukprot:6201914-Pleurochrysis_carterae.AAC.2